MGSLVLDQLETFGPEHCAQLDYAQASAYTRDLAQHHYENFTVVSRLLPKRLRDDFAHVYAFCRWADDLGDETGDAQRSLELLDWWRNELTRCYDDQPRHPVFVALHHTVRKHDIPRKPFDDLIDAFVQDQRVTRYRTWDEVVDYCTRSADPVGRLVLYMCGYRDAQRQQLSDATCTALQLTNFWQDVRRDVLERDRVYIPEEVACRHGMDIEMMVKTLKLEARAAQMNQTNQTNRANPTGPACDCDPTQQPGPGVRAQLPAYRATIRELVRNTWPLFAEGRKLWPMLSRDVRPSIELFTRGGEAVLHRIERIDHQTLLERPRLGKPIKLALMLRTLIRRMM